MSEYFVMLFNHYNWLTLSNLVFCVIALLLMMAFVSPAHKKISIPKTLLAINVMFWFAYIIIRITTFTYDGNVDLGEWGLNLTLTVFLIYRRGNVYQMLNDATSPFSENKRK